MEIGSNYDSGSVEDKWYKYWEEKGYFKSVPDEREPFTILIPPPNVTGVLHMGHMLNNTIQDVLIRKARLEGKNACWVPGTDHASIATEAKVVRKLREQGIKKSDLSRDEFMKHAWEWTDNYGGIILSQLKKLGASCDWDRTAFTMDDKRYKGVIKVFVDLYNKGKLYRGHRMVNWDPEAQTVLSNEEVLHKEESAKLYHVRYQIQGTDDYITIATTRPETILGDSAIAVHPDDPRYTQLKGKHAIVPKVNRAIPIIFDNYVDIEFGTGALKVTPAHDVNDYELGKKHNLEVIDILNDDGSIAEAGQFYVGKDRYEARKLIIKDLQASSHLVDIEDLVHNVGRSERTNAVVEPKLSLQWYVDMQSLAKPAHENVQNDTIQFYPEKYKNTYAHWMENIRDWCISRQLWWGHRIPAYYYEDKVYVAETADEALSIARKDLSKPELQLTDLRQDDDVLDTWFSSWLWPISVFDGFEDQTELDYYYPTSVLVTGWDIIFLWVARMIMAGYEWKGEFPYKDVYFTGMVRDKQRRKMSKSLGNSPDALKLIEDYGADGVRYGMLSCSPAGGDLLYDDSLVDNGRKFTNKIWNAVSYVLSQEVDDSLPMPDHDQLAINWINNLLDDTINSIQHSFSEYRLSEALMTIYKFAWNELFSWYLEIIKPDYQQPINPKTLEESVAVFEKVCIILHPFMPFITEEVWHQLRDRAEGEDCIVSHYPKPREVIDKQLLNQMELVKNIISNVRDIKNKNQVSSKELVSLTVIDNDEIEACFQNKGAQEIIRKLAFVDEIKISKTDEGVSGISFISGKTKVFAHLDLEVDVEAELAKAQEMLEYELGFVKSVSKKLSNERFVSGAPEQVVANERKKLADGEARVKSIQERIDQLKRG